MDEVRRGNGGKPVSVQWDHEIRRNSCEYV